MEVCAAVDSEAATALAAVTAASPSPWGPLAPVELVKRGVFTKWDAEFASDKDPSDPMTEKQANIVAQLRQKVEMATREWPLLHALGALPVPEFVRAFSANAYMTAVRNAQHHTTDKQIQKFPDVIKQIERAAGVVVGPSTPATKTAVWWGGVLRAIENGARQQKNMIRNWSIF